MQREYDIKSVSSKNGTFLGRRYDEICAFLGIPYARAQRFKRSVEVRGSEGFLIDATIPGSAPIQSDEVYSIDGPGTCSEDCLNLNLYFFDNCKCNKPVMVWIYGGAQVVGNNFGILLENGDCQLDARRIVEKNNDLIIVVPNYREGIFGSLCVGEIDGASDEYKYSNNLTRLDILESLKWIRNNITIFGGDPNNVTLCGQSAGSANITSLLLMPEAKGYFNRVICESSFAMDISLTTYEHAKIISESIFEKLNIKAIKDILSLSSDELLKAQDELTQMSMGGSPVFKEIPSKLFSPVVDNAVIFDNYWDYLKDISVKDVSFLGGTNEGEYDQQFQRFSDKANWQKAKELLITHCRIEGRENILEKYISNYRENRSEFEAYKDFKNDLYLRMGGISYADVFSKQGKASYFYYLKGSRASYSVPNNSRCPHGAEIDILFYNPSKESDALKDKIRRYFFDFARFGNPNGKNAEEWKEFGKERNTMILSDNCYMSEKVRNKDTALLYTLLKENEENHG